MDINNPSEVQVFVDLMTGMADYYGREFSPAAIRTMMTALAVYPVADIQRACAIYARNPDSGQFMPKVADIVRIIEGDTGSQAGQAWVKADKALRIHGHYVDVCFDDPIIHRVIDDMGGWVKFCTRSDADGYVFQQREFERRYQGYAGRPMPEYPKLLTGLATHSNGVRGFVRRELPCLIGNQENAYLVYQNGSDPGSEKKGPVDFARLVAKLQAQHAPTWVNEPQEERLGITQDAGMVRARQRMVFGGQHADMHTQHAPALPIRVEECEVAIRYNDFLNLIRDECPEITVQNFRSVLYNDKGQTIQAADLNHDQILPETADGGVRRAL